MQKVSIKVNDNVISELKSTFETHTAGAETVVESWYFLRKQTLHELKGVFEASELNAIVDNMNGVMFQPQFSCSSKFLRAQIEDGVIYDGIDEKWDIDKEKFLSKIDKLTSAQVYFLLEEINKFWTHESKKQKSLEDFIERFRIIKSSKN